MAGESSASVVLETLAILSDSGASEASVQQLEAACELTSTFIGLACLKLSATA